MKCACFIIGAFAVPAMVVLSLAYAGVEKAQPAPTIGGPGTSISDGVHPAARPFLGNPTPPPCESTGFEPIGEDFGPPECGWNLGWICDETAFPVDECTMDPIGTANCNAETVELAGKCCAEFPNPNNEWFQSANSQHCTTPFISDANPKSGSQHLRIGPDPSRPTSAIVSAFTPADSGPYPVAPWTVEFDAAMGNPILTPPFGSRLFWLQIGESGFNGRLHWIGQGSQDTSLSGIIYTYDYGFGAYQYLAYLSGEGNYDKITIEGNPCNGTITYTVRTSNQHGNGPWGTYSVTTTFGEDQSLTYVRSTWQANNFSGHYDIDNFRVTRGEPCPAVCGDGILELPEKCEPTDTGGACPGACIAAGLPGECTCDRECESSGNPCILQNGLNGPFTSPFGTNGGWFRYVTVPGSAVAFDSCGSTGMDTRMIVYGSPDTSLFLTSNNNCCNPLAPSCGSLGNGSTPNAACYGDTPPDNLESCACAVSESGSFLIRLWPAVAGTGATVFVNVQKKEACGGPVFGSCCNPEDGSCEDGVLQVDCREPRSDCCAHDSCSNQTCVDAVCSCDPSCCGGAWDTACAGPNVFEPGCSALDLCEICQPDSGPTWSTASCDRACVFGACCDSSPEAGGRCIDDVPVIDCLGTHLTWFENENCKNIPCEEATGACCDSSSGAGGSCFDNVRGSDCEGPHLRWVKGQGCASVLCDEATGACCNSASGAGGACLDDLLAEECEGPQLSWTKGASCDEIFCEEAVGACCDDLTGDCSQMLLGDCPLNAHVAWTKGGSCDVCVAVQGACCDTGSQDPTTATCMHTIQADCNCEKCTWTKNANCGEIICDPNFNTIPTVSEWGLITLTLLLLVGGKIGFSTRKKSAV